jgi:hypothetical protein
MIKEIAGIVAFVLSFSLIPFSDVRASFGETSLYELVNHADAIVVGTVVHKEVAEIQDNALIEELSLPARLGIVTLITLDIQNFVKNPLDKSKIVIVVQGGTINGRGYGTSVDPHFTVGKQYLLFISPLSKRGVVNIYYKDRYEVPCGSMCTFDVENERIKRLDIFVGDGESITLDEAFLQIRAMLAH